MDDYTRRLIALRNVLRRRAATFHDMIEANERAIEPEAVGRIRDLIEASINTIDEMPIT
jgi:hypothetical protein